MGTFLRTPEALIEALRARVPGTLLLQETHTLALETGVSLRVVEREALRAGLVVERYRCNLGTVGREGQIRLLDATVAVVGAGGLGGWVVEGLARMGIGRLVIIDGDSFCESNLNRQLGCTEANLGRPKALCLAERAAAVNGATEIVVRVAWLDAKTASALLVGADLVVDALDSLPVRLVLQDAVAEIGIPLVHGAIAGYTGQVLTIMPGDSGLYALYGDRVPEHGIEIKLGNPSATPMMVAAWQIQEVVKAIVGQGVLLRDRLLFFDAEHGEVSEIHLRSTAQEDGLSEAPHHR